MPHAPAFLSGHFKPAPVLREIGVAHNIPASIGGRRVLGARIKPVRTAERLRACYGLHHSDDDPSGGAESWEAMVGRLRGGTELVAYTYFLVDPSP